MDRRPKILFVMPLPPPVHGAAAVGEMICESAEINSRFDCDYVNSSTSVTLRDVGKVGLRKIIGAVMLYGKVLWKLAGSRYDLCYLAMTCHGAGFLKDAPLALMCKAFGRRVVIHQHNKGMSADVDRWPYRGLFRSVYRGSTVILLSERLYPDISEVVGRDQVLICPNGIGDAVRLERVTDDASHILFLSNLLESKGVLDLVDAIAILKGRGVIVKCTIAGDSSADISSDAFLDYLRKAGVDDLVDYRGPVYGWDKEPLWHQAGVFVLPSLNECQPLVILEAMSHGLPVIATDEGGICDMVIDGENGLIVRKKDSADLADKLQYLVEHPDVVNEMGKAGSGIYQERFTQEKFIRRFCGCIQSVLEK